MAKKLSDMVNIGPQLEKMLINCGIHTADDLMKTGAIQACLSLKLKDQACYNKLYALEGAIQGIRWHELSKDARAQLKTQYDSVV